LEVGSAGTPFGKKSADILFGPEMGQDFPVAMQVGKGVVTWSWSDVACGVVACGVVACGVVACGVVTCGVVAFDTFRSFRLEKSTKSST
jgi:uncharacterized protein (DUF2062 family)